MLLWSMKSYPLNLNSFPEVINSHVWEGELKQGISHTTIQNDPQEFQI